MTFCLGIKCKDGLVAIADTRITSGSEVSTAKKIAVHQGERHAMFVLTSGLRSVRDKAITYFEERWRQNGTQLSRSYEAVNALAGEIRRVYEEDNDWLVKAGLHFDLHCIVGSQLTEDDSPHLYLLYPQGNWVEVSRGTPYLIIGETRFGKPILDRALRYDASLEQALRLGVLSFNSTEASSADVGPPLDAVVYAADSFGIRERRFNAEELAPVAQFWQRAIEDAAEQATAPIAPLARSLGIDPAS
ncbi:MAG: peptidase [Chloroflexi bacterium]|nr:peptidase [Chloroflexota bacterium]